MRDKRQRIHHQGYTLIEIMVVVVVIGIITSVALALFNPKKNNVANDTEKDAKYLQKIILQGQNSAVLTQKTHGLHYLPQKGFWLSRYEPYAQEKKEGSHPREWVSTKHSFIPHSKPTFLIKSPLQFQNPIADLKQFQEQRNLPFLIIYPNKTTKPSGSVRFDSQNSNPVFLHFNYKTISILSKGLP